MVALTGISLLFNSHRKYGIAKVFLFALNSFSIWITYHVFNVDYSVLSSFFPILFCFPIFFDINKEKLAFTTSFLLVLLCIVSSFIFPRQLIHSINLSPEVAAQSNLFHIIISFILTILVAYVVVRNRNTTQQRLILEREKAENALLKLKQTQAHLVENEKMASLGTLLAGVSHEINNPLNFIKGSVNVFEKEFKENFKDASPHYSKYFEILNEGVYRLTNITKSLNHFNYQTPDLMNDCDLSIILNNCLNILKYELKDHVEIQNEIPKSILLKGNSGQLHQVFLNIINNSIHAIDKNGQLTISTCISENAVSTSIVDNGKGIDSKSMERIFDPFYTTKEPGKGTGLGLSIAYKIVKDHLGTIDIKSDVNSGTQVIVTLPLSEN
jgi:signal transduction histidine kinase